MAKKPIIRYFDRGVWYDATVSDIGNLEELNTVHKTTVVEAINDIIGGNINISGELLEKLTALDNNISRIDGLIASGSLNETQANQMNQFVTNKLNELSQSMEELNKQRDQRLKEQEEKVAQLKLDSESDRQRIEEITGDLNATKEKLNNAELNVTSVTQLVDEINGKISQAVSKTDFDLLEGTVREQKTLIDQTAEGIKLLATKEELDKTNENVKSIKSEVDVQAGLIESKVSSEQLINEMEKIDKYMPNLLRYTRNWQDWENDDEANIDVTLNEYRDCIIQRARGIGKGLSTTVEDLVIGETYSLSVWVKHDDTNAKLYAMVNNEEIIMTDLNSKETFVNNEFKRMRCSFVAQGTTAKVRFIFKNCRTDSYGYLAGAKCEKNKKVSGWQPNSEDVYQSIKSARSEIKQTDNKITTLVGTVTKQGDLISSNTTSIEETDKAIKLQAESIKTLNESIESTKAELKVNSDAITSKVWKTDVGEMISDINIDNKNRVLNSDFGDGWELWSETNNLFQLKKIGNYKFAVAERSGLPQNMAIAIATNKFPVKHNERLMFGFYFYCADLSKLDNKIVGALELLDINDIRIDRVDFDVSKLSLGNGSFTKLSNTYFVEDERIVKARLRFFLNRNGNIGFALPMAQAGDIKSSDWSLAPEDVARRFNDTNVTISNYEQTVNGFKQTVESYKGSVDGYSNQVSEFNQTVNGFNQTIKDYKESNDRRVEQLETSLTTQSGKIEAVVKESKGTKDELGKLTANGGRISQLELTAQGFSTTVGEISKKVNDTNGRIDNIKVGGRNLLRKSTVSEENLQYLKATNASVSVVTEGNLKYYKIRINDNLTTNANGAVYLSNDGYYNLVKDKHYIFSYWIKVNVNYDFNFRSIGHSQVCNYRDSDVTGERPHVDTNRKYNVSSLVANTWTKVTIEFDMLYDGYFVPFFWYLRSGMEICVYDLMLEEGNAPTAWNTAPEDQQYQIDSINNNLREKYMTIEQSNSWIEQKKDSIVQGVKSSIETLGTRLDNLQVGGRNLLLQTGFFTGGKLSDVVGDSSKINLSKTIVTDADSPSGKAYRINKSKKGTENINGGCYWVVQRQLTPGKKYTWSVYVRGEGTVDTFGPEQGGAKSVTLTSSWTKVSHTFTANSNKYYQFTFYSTSEFDLYFTDLMLEEGTAPSPWRPAPEDYDGKIDRINNNLSDNYYQKTDVDSKLSTTVDGITAQYTQDITTRLGDYYDKSTIDSKLMIDGQGITTYVKSTQSKLDNLSIGGSNLITKTGEEFVMGYGIPNTTWENGRAILRYGKGNDPSQASSEILPQNGMFDDFVMKRGVVYTQSMIVETDANANLNGAFNFTWFNPSVGHVYKRGNVKKIGNEMYLIWCTASVNEDNYKLRAFDTINLKQVFYYYNSGSYIAFSKPKLEEGNKPTAWSPSPEDYNDKINGVSGSLDDLDKKIGNIDTWKTEVAESFIEQTANSLSALIKDKNGSSLMSFDSTSATWSFNTSVLENNISDAKDAGDKAQKTANEANSLAKDLKNLLNDIQDKTAYITMTTYNGQPCIELGKTDNKFKVRITNTSVDFLDGSSRVAYVSNNQLYINKAMVKNEFQIGEGTGFVWKKRSNGNMGLRWGGGVTTVQTKYRYSQSAIDTYSKNGYVGWWEVYNSTDRFIVGDEVAFEIFNTDKNKYVYLHALVVDKDATRLKTTSINVVDY